MSLFKVKSLPRQTVAVLSLTSITVCKLVVLLVLLKAGYVQLYATGNAHNLFLSAANRILTTGTYNDPDTIYSSMAAPGYSVFLAFIQWIGASWYLSLVACVQMLLDYCVALLLLFLGSRETTSEAGWLAGVLWLVFPPAVVISTWVTAETLFTALLVLSMVILMRSLSQQGGVGLSFAAGLSLGVTTLVRGTTQFLPVFLCAILCFRSIPKRLFKWVFVFIGMYLVVLPWTLRNLYVLGEPIIVQTGFGAVFLQGSRSEYLTIPGRQALSEKLAQSTDSKVISDKKATSEDRWLFNLGVREYRIRLEQEPWSFLPFIMHKFARLWYGLDTGTVYQQLFLGICSLLTVPIGIYQVWLWRRDHLHLSLIIGLLTLYLTIITLIGLPLFRYMIPLYPFLIFAASHQYLKLFKRLRMHTFKRLPLHPSQFVKKGQAV